MKASEHWKFLADRPVSSAFFTTISTLALFVVYSPYLDALRLTYTVVGGVACVRLLVLVFLLLIGGPTAMLGGSFARYAHDAYSAFDNNTVLVKKPEPAVADWPLVGKRVYRAWSSAADNLPAFIISLPVIAYLWWAGDASTTSNIVYTIYLIVAGLADNVLKPLLLGRGVEVPMPVILLGALGGMVSGGIIGMFVGVALLVVGYQVFMDWIDNAETDISAEPGQIEPE